VVACRRSAAKLLSKDEAWRIWANIAKTVQLAFAGSKGAWGMSNELPLRESLGNLAIPPVFKAIAFFGLPFFFWRHRCRDLAALTFH
jgi:hypothetical protein